MTAQTFYTTRPYSMRDDKGRGIPTTRNEAQEKFEEYNKELLLAFQKVQDEFDGGGPGAGMGQFVVPVYLSWNSSINVVDNVYFDLEDNTDAIVTVDIDPTKLPSGTLVQFRAVFSKWSGWGSPYDFSPTENSYLTMAVHGEGMEPTGGTPSTQPTVFTNKMGDNPPGYPEPGWADLKSTPVPLSDIMVSPTTPGPRRFGFWNLTEGGNKYSLWVRAIQIYFLQP